MIDFIKRFFQYGIEEISWLFSPKQRIKMNASGGVVPYQYKTNSQLMHEATQKIREQAIRDICEQICAEGNIEYTTYVPDIVSKLITKGKSSTIFDTEIDKARNKK